MAETQQTRGLFFSKMISYEDDYNDLGDELEVEEELEEDPELLAEEVEEAETLCPQESDELTDREIEQGDEFPSSHS